MHKRRLTGRGEGGCFKQAEILPDEFSCIVPSFGAFTMTVTEETNRVDVDCIFWLDIRYVEKGIAGEFGKCTISFVQSISVVEIAV